jgi:hypothetical protein
LLIARMEGSAACRLFFHVCPNMGEITKKLKRLNRNQGQGGTSVQVRA